MHTAKHKVGRTHPGRKELKEMAEKLALDAGVSPKIFLKLIGAESSWNAHVKDSPKGAVGMAQVRPDTFTEILPKGNIRDIKDNMTAGARYLKKLQEEFGEILGIAAYNMGPTKMRSERLLHPQDMLAHIADEHSETNGYLIQIFDEGELSTEAD